MDKPISVKILPDEPAEIIGRQLIGLGCAIGAAAILIYCQRKMSGPDFFETQRMRLLHKTAQYADSRVRFWNEVSAKLTAMYLESRP